MPWKLQPVEHKVFDRNPLSVVIAQLRFHPILKIPERIADFQEKVRPRFPVYLEQVSRSVELRDVAGVHVKDERQFVFQNPDDGSSLFLSTTALGLETRNHRDRKDFQRDIRLALEALQEVHGEFSGTRLGLRYVNTLARESIAADLGRSVEWSDLVTEPFLRIPGDPGLGSDTAFSGEISSDASDGGRLTLRYGLVQPPGAGVPVFRLDLDRFAASGITGDAVLRMLDTFADDIFVLFQSSVGPALAEWMEG